ncbi:MAG: SPW repeat protein [Marmoricola sp.]
MKRTMHAQQVIPLIAGTYAFLCPMWTTTSTKASWTVIVLGVITALAALTAMFRPDMMSREGFTALMGVLFFVSPWAMNFSGNHMIAWTAWIVGAVTFLAGAGELRGFRGHGGRMAHSH